MANLAFFLAFDCGSLTNRTVCGFLRTKLLAGCWSDRSNRPVLLNSPNTVPQRKPRREKAPYWLRGIMWPFGEEKVKIIAIGEQEFQWAAFCGAKKIIQPWCVNKNLVVHYKDRILTIFDVNLDKYRAIDLFRDVKILAVEQGVTFPMYVGFKWHPPRRENQRWPLNSDNA
ncbi:hypothetical protein Cgig2_011514 [Carnegiea gigantea]|uniref:Uncharacterized protein n=1 Tax=Carnegiea gigantea TaxID=171969 RepID=A0A9Q1GWB3_9CARY|nr:hypothetical protein Cgig2_011514 [Carnegiea gigantea]